MLSGIRRPCPVAGHGDWVGIGTDRLHAVEHGCAAPPPVRSSSCIAHRSWPTVNVRTTQSDGVDAPRRHRSARVEVFTHHSREASMGQVSIIGLDLAKSVFQAHGADASGAVVYLITGRGRSARWVTRRS
jgi:hypothetical protein